MAMERFQQEDQHQRQSQVQGKAPPKARAGVVNGAGFTGLAVVGVGVRLAMGEMAAAMLPAMECILGLQAQPDNQRGQRQG